MQLVWAALTPAFGEDARVPRETRQAVERLLARTEADEDAHGALVQELLAEESLERLLLVGMLSEDLVATVCRQGAETYGAYRVADADKDDLVKAHMDVFLIGADLGVAEAAYRVAKELCSSRRTCAEAEEGLARTRSAWGLPPPELERARSVLLEASVEGRPLGVCGSMAWRISQELRAAAWTEAERRFRSEHQSTCSTARDW